MKFIKNTFCFLFVMSFVMLFPAFGGQTVSCAASGDGELPYVVDNAELLSSSEVKELSGKLKEISERQMCDVIVYTVLHEQMEGKDIQACADDTYDYLGYGKGDDNSGIILLIAMKDKKHGDYAFSTCGYGITAFTDAGIKYLGESLVSYMKEQDYVNAFGDFADSCDSFLKQAKSGKPYDKGNMPRSRFAWPLYLICSLAAGLIIGLIAVLVMKGKLKSVRPQRAAASYIKPGSMHLTREADMFLYSTVHRSKREKSDSGGGSSTHTSSSGNTHGGGSGSF